VRFFRGLLIALVPALLFWGGLAYVFVWRPGVSAPAPVAAQPTPPAGAGNGASPPAPGVASAESEPGVETTGSLGRRGNAPVPTLR
jgi:hypothetical protein